MKKLLTLLVLLTASYVTKASNGDQPKLVTRATLLTQQMAKKIPINEGQYIKVRQLNLRLLSEKQAIQAQYAEDPATLDQQLAEAQNRYEWDLASILWPRQMASYEQAKTDLTAFNEQ